MQLQIDPDLVRKPEQVINSVGLPPFNESFNPIASGMEGNFLDQYLNIHKNQKMPLNFLRWSAVSVVATLLERNVYIPFAGDALYPNFYILLVGESASLKTKAWSRARAALELAGYPNFSPNRITMKNWHKTFSLAYKSRRIEHGALNANKLKVDALASIMGQEGTSDIKKDAMLSSFNIDNHKSLLEIELMVLETMNERDRINAVALYASEFSEAVPTGSAPIIYSLTDMFDTHLYTLYEFDDKILTNPCVNIFSCITEEALAAKFSVDQMQAGFLTRTIPVYGQKSSSTSNPHLEGFIPSDDNYTLTMLRKIRNLRGQMVVSPEASEFTEEIDEHNPRIEDIRFQSYNGRRYSHLMKLAMVRAAGDLRTTITREDILWSNTLLTYTEIHMPSALGDFGTTVVNGIFNSVKKVINAEDSGVCQLSDLITRVKMLRPQQSQHEVNNCIQELIRDGELIRTDTDSYHSVVHLKDSTSSLIANMDGVLYDSTLIQEWRL